MKSSDHSVDPLPSGGGLQAHTTTLKRLKGVGEDATAVAATAAATTTDGEDSVLPMPELNRFVSERPYLPLAERDAFDSNTDTGMDHGTDPSTTLEPAAISTSATTSGGGGAQQVEPSPNDNTSNNNNAEGAADVPDTTDYGPAIAEAIHELKFLSDTSRLKKERPIPKIRWRNIQMGVILGVGGFSQVNRAQVTNSPDLEDGHYALKCLDDRFLQQHSKKHIIEAALDIAVEGEILSRLHHPNIITLHGTSMTNLIEVKFSDKGMRDYFLLLDVLEETLYDRLQVWRRKTFLKNLVGRPLSKRKMLDRIQTAAIGVARGMQYLHEKKIVLRDLKPENVGFDGQGVPKLFDFGFARESHNVRADEIAGR
jgi:hypothetical protein